MPTYRIYHSTDWEPLATTNTYISGVMICEALSLGNPGHVYILASSDSGAIGSAMNGVYDTPESEH